MKMGKTTRAILLTIAAALFFLPFAGCDNPVNPPTEFTITQGTPAPTNGSFEFSPATAIAGRQITLTATVNSGYEFYRWDITGADVTPVAGSETGVWTFYMPAANITVNVVFRAEDAEVFQINKGTHANGTLTISPEEAAEGETVTLTAMANSGYEFYRWDITGADVTPVAGSETGVWTFYMPAANIAVNVVFRVIDDNGNDNGNGNGNDNGNDNGDENGAVLVDSGHALRSNQGANVNAATLITDFASRNLRNVRFVAENFQTLGGTSRFHSIWLELSSGEAIGVTGRRVSTANPSIDRFGVGLGARSNMVSGSAATHVAIGVAPGFQVTSDAGIPNITARFPGFNLLSNTPETANVYDISVDITPAGAGTLSIRLAGRSPNGEWGALSEPVVRTFDVAPGTIVASAHAWSHTNSTMTIPGWRLYDTSVQSELPGNVGSISATVQPSGLVDFAWPPAIDAAEYVITITGGASPIIIPISAPSQNNERTHRVSSGLVNGTNYTVSIVGRNVLGESVVPALNTFSPSLAAVTGLTAAGGIGQADLGWNALPAATSFRVYRAPGASGGTFTHVGTAPAGATAFSDTGLADGTFRWQVVSVNYAGESQSPRPQALATITGITTAPAGVPGNFQVQAGHASGLAILTWQAVELANAYEVRHRRSGGSWSSPVNVGNILTYTFTGLGDGHMYEFGVQARNQHGVSTGGWASFGPVEVNAPDFNVEAGVWFETIFAYWTAAEGSAFNVFVAPAGTPENNAAAWRWVNNPSEAVTGQPVWRNNHSHLVRIVDAATNRWRVDVPGLAADNNQSYDLRIVELVGGTSAGHSETVTELRPPPFDRQGFAFSETSPFGHTTGAYNRDGTLRSDAIVLYVTNETINNFAAHNPWGLPFFSTTQGAAVFDRNRSAASSSALTIRNQVPVALRFIGTVLPTPEISNSGDGLGFRRMANLTIEGIGSDAEIRFSIHVARSSNVVVRNLTFRNWGTGDGIHIESNTNVGLTHEPKNVDLIGSNPNFDRVSVNTWVTHNRFFNTQAPDAQIDVNSSTYHTQSWNVFNQMGGDNRGGLVGGTQSRSHARVTFHNNLYNNVRTRAPRLRISEAHIFNNVHLGGGQAYAVGAGHHAHAIVEGNYYDNLARTLIMAGQGTGAGTLSGDHPGFLITTYTTSDRHTTTTHRWVEESGDRIFALAAVLQPNEMTGSPTFNPYVDQGFPTLNNDNGTGRDFLWNFQDESWAGASSFVLYDQSTWPMPVRVTTAQEARVRVENYAGPMPAH